ncbi:MAG TPA: hypothetical protein VH393_06885 [Ktedonobacterales bacterium]
MVVEAVFLLRGRGVAVIPLTPFGALPQPVRGSMRCNVTLRRPDGSSQTIEAIFGVGTCIPPDRLGYECLLQGIEKAEVPAGIEIWIDA